LPKDASARRRFCGPNCVAGAYRLRRRRERARMLTTILIDAKAHEFLRTAPHVGRCCGRGSGAAATPGTARRGAGRARTGHGVDHGAKP
jgi:hypothetical protein